MESQANKRKVITADEFKAFVIWWQIEKAGLTVPKRDGKIPEEISAYRDAINNQTLSIIADTGTEL